MENKWSDKRAADYVERYGPRWGEDLALCTYLSTLVGSECRLVLHGGGNMSVKSSRANIFGENIPIIFVKASGFDMASMAPDGYTALNLEYLKKLRALPRISDEDMLNEFQTHLCNAHSSAPSIETLAHAFIPKKFIEHTHADAILALTNQHQGEALLREALGPDVLILEYMTPGFQLAQAAAAAYEKNPGCKAMVWMRHGLLSWGGSIQEAFLYLWTLQRACDVQIAAASAGQARRLQPAVLAQASREAAAGERIVYDMVYAALKRKLDAFDQGFRSCWLQRRRPGSVQPASPRYSPRPVSTSRC